MDNFINDILNFIMAREWECEGYRINLEYSGIYQLIMKKMITEENSLILGIINKEDIKIDIDSKTKDIFIKGEKTVPEGEENVEWLLKYID